MNLSNWQRTKDGAKGKNPPAPIPRPGVKAPETTGKHAIPMDEMANWLAAQLAPPDVEEN